MRTFRQWALSGLLAVVLVVPARAADVDRYVPADTEQVVVINVKQLLDSPLVKKHALPEIEKQLKNNKEVKKVSELTGLDPLKDINTLIIANAGSTGDKVTMVVRGKFDTDKIHTVAQAVAKDKPDEVKISKLGDRHLYEGMSGGKSFYLTFVDGTTLVGSTSKDILSAAIDGKGDKNKELIAALEKLDSKQSVIAAGVVPGEVRMMLGGLNQGPADALSKLKTVAGSVNVSQGVAAGVRLSTGNAKAAAEIAEFAEMAKGLLAFAGMGNQNVADLVKELLKTLNIKSTQGDVTIDFKVSEGAIDKAIKAAPRRGPRNRQ